MQQIYAVGETILDIIFKEGQPQAAKPGGSSFNASITLGRLGAPVTFISEMGRDRVGDLIAAFLDENGVGQEYVDRYEEGKSAISLAFLNERSDAEYDFYKDYPHQRLAVEFPEFQSGDLLMFGSFYALNPGIRPRVKLLLDKAMKAGASIIYDPNFRKTHLPEREQLLPVIRENMSYAHLVRASDEDLENIFNASGVEEAWRQVSKHSPVLVYTANANGIFLRTSTLSLDLEVERIQPLSTIGAGDTFNAGLLFGIWQRGLSGKDLESLGAEAWTEILQQAASFSREVCLSYENYLPLEVARNFNSPEG